MNLERGFRRLVVALSFAVVGLGIATDILMGLWPQFTRGAGVLFALLWVGFYAVRWVARGFTP
jgi:hypothetical protein